MNGIAPVREQARDAQRRILDVVLRDGSPVSIVNSPPGAGKTRLIESVVATAVQHVGLRVAVAVPRAEQSFDLLRRLLGNFDPMQIDVLQSRTRPLPADLDADPRLPAPVSDPGGLRRGPGVSVGTAAKFVVSVDRFGNLPDFDLLVCDESYQIPSKDLDLLIPIGRQVLLVGDPGQLPPLVRSDITRFEAARYRVHWPGPQELLRRFPDITVERLPATFRFLQDTVDFIQPSFYRDLEFASARSPQERRLRFGAVGMGSAIDRALDLVAGGATIVGILLPERPVGRDEVDDEVSETMARVCRRAIDREPEWVGQGPIGEQQIGCIDPHVASGAAARRHLLAAGMSDDLMVDTPEIWQGLQRPLIAIKHPLSGLRRLDEFALRPGGLCVMLSRHQLGCVMVGRDGVRDALDRYQHDSGQRPAGAQDLSWAGWQSHATLWDELERRGRLVRTD